MLKRLYQLPLFFLLWGLCSAAMFVPMGYALAHQSFFEARMFGYSAVLGLFLLFMVGLALSNRKFELSGVRQLSSLLLGFVLLPFYLAIPFNEALGTTWFSSSYLEMVSALTTTGFRTFDAGRLSETLHLWRALVAWLGGGIMWVTAAAILAPMNLGGFEVTAAGNGEFSTRQYNFSTSSEMAHFLERTVNMMVPTYAGLTMVLWILLVMSGDMGLNALVTAMSVMSTSGMSMQNFGDPVTQQWLGEAIILMFFVFALSHHTFSDKQGKAHRDSLRNDPELRLGIFICLALPLALFLRHWIGALDQSDQSSFASGLSALWGGFFTVMSFLTTTGYQSSHWVDAQTWSGMQTPGVIFLGLALVGGGVATTAGGVKLLRVYALYLNADREMEVLVYPSSVGRRHKHLRSDLLSGSFIAWVFFMLFVVTLSVNTLAFSALGLSFEDALILCISALSTTGPLIDMVQLELGSIADLPVLSKAVLSLTMILGRLEILVVIALVSPSIWRS